MHQLPETGYVEISQIIGQTAVSEQQARENQKKGKSPKRPRDAIPGVFPVGKSTWWEGVRSGRFPKPVRFGGRTFWKVEDIRALIQQATV